MPMVDTEALRAAGPRSWSGSRTGRSTSSGRRRRRCCSTKSTGCCSPRCARSATSARPASPTPSRCSTRTGRSARPLAGGTDLVIRLRDGSLRPDVVVDVKWIPELDAAIRAGRRPPGDRGARGHDRHRRGRRASAATSPRWPRRRSSWARPRSATGRRWRATCATPRPRPTRRPPCSCTGPWSWRPARRASGGSRSASFWVRSGVTTLARGELVTADRAAGAGRPPRPRARATDAAARPRPRVGDAGLLGRARRGDPARVRERRTAAAARVDETGRPRRPRRAGRRQGGASSSACSRAPPRRRPRCGPAPSTAWRCSACSDGAPSRPPSTPRGRGRPAMSDPVAIRARGQRPPPAGGRRRTTRSWTCCATTSG